MLFKKILVLVLVSVFLFGDDDGYFAQLVNGATNIVKTVNDANSSLSKAKALLKTADDLTGGKGSSLIEKGENFFSDFNITSFNTLQAKIDEDTKNSNSFIGAFNSCYDFDVEIKVQDLPLLDLCGDGLKINTCETLDNKLGVIDLPFIKKAKRDTKKTNMNIDYCDYIGIKQDKKDIANVDLLEKKDNIGAKVLKNKNVVALINNPKNKALINYITSNSKVDDKDFAQNLQEINTKYTTVDDYKEDTTKTYRIYASALSSINPITIIENSLIEVDFYKLKEEEKQQKKIQLLKEFDERSIKFKDIKMQFNAILHFDKLNDIIMPTKDYIDSVKGANKKAEIIKKIQLQQINSIILESEIDSLIEEKRNLLANLIEANIILTRKYQ